jgi:Cd2+/Zn2+-exporting ATPase
MKEYQLHNLDCAECGLKIEKGLEEMDSVKYASVNFALSKLYLETDDVEAALKRIGQIEPSVKVTEHRGGEERFKKNRELALMAVSAILFFTGFALEPKLHDSPYPFVEYFIFLAAYLLSGWRVLFRAGKNIVRGNIFDENFLMTVATVGAIAIHQLSEAVGVMLFFQVGEFFQELSLNHSRKSIKSLLDIRPQVAHRKTNGSLDDVHPEMVKVDEIIVIKPGEKVPLDGVVVEGSSNLDTSPLTGEPVPRRVRKNDTVLAGMINTTGVLTIRVSRLFRDSSIAKILYLVEKATEKKAKTERFITRFARYYAPLVVSVAVVVAVLPPLVVPGALFSDWIYRALVLLVISCPCALVVSIPLGYFGGIGKASRRGILIKGSNYLDALTQAENVVFDKTGTLTRGVFRVSEIVARNGFSREQVLSLAAQAESHSAHPIAQSILEASKNPPESPDLQELEEIGGMGIRARIGNRIVLVGNDRLLHEHHIAHDTCDVEGTVVHVVADSLYAGYIVISDEIKENAAKAVDSLRGLGVRKIGMLTGDSRYEAERTSRKLGLDFFYADLLPEGKVEALEEIMHGQSQRDREKTVFVGDGINDAPVIARADIGMAMGNLGSDAAIETADIVLMTDSPEKVSESIGIARKTRTIVWENILLALLVKGIFMGLGISGFATMWQAVFADMGVALVAIFNALRVLR